jgi:tRNA threonylcarbamoyl adenosine modification protein YjeE
MSLTFAAPIQRTFPTEDALTTFATDFAAQLQAGDTIALDGPLGAGKTTFVRAIVKALHGEDQTSSPTFTFWHRYPPTTAAGKAPPIDHLDLYRIDDPSEITELGLEDAFDGHSIVLVEWWSNAPHLLPAARYHVDIEGAGDEPRTVRVSKRP